MTGLCLARPGANIFGGLWVPISGFTMTASEKHSFFWYLDIFGLCALKLDAVAVFLGFYLETPT